MTKTVFGGRYVQTKVSAAGGMGSIVVCDDPNLERKVAIKFLQPFVDKKRIHDEILALQQVRSKHVVQVYDLVIHQPGNQVGIVQEYLTGQDLVEYRNANKPQLNEYLRILYQLASGITDIHAHKITHRDIKPNNAKFDSEGLLKIFDFGLSRVGDTKAQTKGFIGTKGFAAPELYVSGLVQFTNEVDVYAFGMTALYLSLNTLPAAVLPGASGGPDTTAWLTAGGFSALGTTIPPKICKLLNRCVAHDRKDRPSMREVRDALAAHLLSGSHRALVAWGSGNTVCDAKNNAAKISHAGNELIIKYDGLAFVVTSVAGHVYLNNIPATPNHRIDGSCVITLGPGPKNRLFVTLDVSHPEVVL